MYKRTLILSLAALAASFSAGAFADGIPQPGQLGFQEAASPVKEQLHHMHNILLYIIFAISLFVMALLGIIIVKYNSRSNPVASKVTHNTVLEIVWTALPIIILVSIAIPSLKILYFMDKAQEADMTLKVVGRQWYWSYEYPDHGGFKFDSYMVEDKDLKPGQIRLLDVDNPVVVPVGATVRVLITGADVIHNWYVPALGVNKAANPGRLNETWFKVEKEGVYYGQCAQLCGVRHGFMPIMVKAVSQEEFNKWVEEAKVKFASIDNGSEYKLASGENSVSADNVR